MAVTNLHEQRIASLERQARELERLILQAERIRLDVEGHLRRMRTLDPANRARYTGRERRAKS